MRLTREEFSGPDGRYHRQELISWWDQERVADARILVVGAGALGNEILKNLALLGARRVLVYDMDRIEWSNLSRSVLFRTSDEGEAKAETAARGMRELDPESLARGIPENVLNRAGIGVFLWADVVICGVDNREARIFVNRACALTAKTWVDGAIEGYAGTVRGFRPCEGACYECTMNETDRRQVAERRSCALLARDVAADGFVPATVTTASVVAALQVQEALKILHGQPALISEGIHLDGFSGRFDRVGYPVRDDCFGHESVDEFRPLGLGVADISVGDLLARVADECGEGTVLELSRDLVTGLTCPRCETMTTFGAALGAVREREAACPACGEHRIVETTASLQVDGRTDPSRTPADIGVPPYDLVTARRGLTVLCAYLFDGDAGSVLGELAGS